MCCNVFRQEVTCSHPKKGSPTPVRFEVLRKPRLSNEGMGVSREWEIPEAEMGLVCVLAKLYSGWWLNQPTWNILVK